MAHIASSSTHDISELLVEVASHVANLDPPFLPTPPRWVKPWSLAGQLSLVGRSNLFYRIEAPLPLIGFGGGAQGVVPGSWLAGRAASQP